MEEQRKMGLTTPQKDNECEKQINAGMESQENFKKNLVSEFAQWRRKIKPLYELLGTKPTDEVLEKLIFEGLTGEAVEAVTQDLVWKCREIHDQLVTEVETKKAVGKATWNEIINLWTELDENEEFGTCFSNAEAGIFNALQELKAQYCKRKIDKSRRLKEFICELRTEISEIWEVCRITEEEKKQFIEFESCEFTEEMLKIHKEELEKWKVYHRKNQEILTKFNKREVMWKTLRELDAKANDPSRFVNRGGALLKDQNMHNYITKTLPKLEADIVNLAEKFENEHGKKMKISGEEIPVLIEKEWKLFKEERGKKSSRTGPSPAKSTPLAMRRSIAPNVPAPPQIRPLEKRFGSKLDVCTAPANKRTKLQPLKAIPDQ